MLPNEILSRIFFYVLELNLNVRHENTIVFLNYITRVLEHCTIEHAIRQFRLFYERPTLSLEMEHFLYRYLLGDDLVTYLNDEITTSVYYL